MCCGRSILMVGKRRETAVLGQTYRLCVKGRWREPPGSGGDERKIQGRRKCLPKVTGGPSRLLSFMFPHSLQ